MFCFPTNKLILEFKSEKITDNTIKQLRFWDECCVKLKITGIAKPTITDQLYAYNKICSVLYFEEK